MKAISLLLLRLSTGIYLVLWGLVKLINQGVADRVSDTYYAGIISGQTINLGLGALQILVGVMVILGLMRAMSYWAQLLWYVAGIIPIIAYIFDPFAVYLVENAKLTFFPSTTLLIASWVLILFKEYDTVSLDAKRN